MLAERYLIFVSFWKQDVSLLKCVFKLLIIIESIVHWIWLVLCLIPVKPIDGGEMSLLTLEKLGKVGRLFLILF